MELGHILIPSYKDFVSSRPPRDIARFSYKNLVSFTDNFSESNYIGHFQFGKFYHGKVKDFFQRDMMVKLWQIPETCDYKPGDNEARLMEEIILNHHEMINDHPCMLKLHGYCREGGHLGALYLFKPLDSLLTSFQEDFTWLQRIKAALGLASLLTSLHAEEELFFNPLLIHNLDATHIMLEEDYTPKLCDFGSIRGGIFPDRGRTYSGRGACSGCIDISNTGRCSSKQDVFAFGVILVSLISRKVYTEADAPFFRERALTEFEGGMENTNEFSLVDGSLAAEGEISPADGHKITMVALDCVKKTEHERPTMNQVFGSLLELDVVRKHAHFLDVDKFRCPCKNAL